MAIITLSLSIRGLCNVIGPLFHNPAHRHSRTPPHHHHQSSLKFAQCFFYVLQISFDLVQQKG